MRLKQLKGQVSSKMYPYPRHCSPLPPPPPGVRTSGDLRRGEVNLGTVTAPTRQAGWGGTCVIYAFSTVPSASSSSRDSVFAACFMSCREQRGEDLNRLCFQSIAFSWIDYPLLPSPTVLSVAFSLFEPLASNVKKVINIQPHRLGKPRFSLGYVPLALLRLF